MSSLQFIRKFSFHFRLKRSLDCLKPIFYRLKKVGRDLKLICFEYHRTKVPEEMIYSLWSFFSVLITQISDLECRLWIFYLISFINHKTPINSKFIAYYHYRDCLQSNSLVLAEVKAFQTHKISETRKSAKPPKIASLLLDSF